MYRQNVELWGLLRELCDTPSWAAAEGEINLVHAALCERQAEVETLQHSLKESQTVKARLLAVRGEREKAQVNLKAAQEGKAEASRALAAVLEDNEALEEELEEQTGAMQDLQRYLAKCQATQQEEHLEELGEVAAHFYASPSSVFALRRRREAFSLLRLAAHRSRRLRELGMRFEAAGAKVLAHKALASLAQHRRMAQHCRRVQERQDVVLLRSVWGAWHRHTKQEQFFQLAVRRRLLRWCLTGWCKVAAEGQRRKRLEAQTQKLRDKRLLRGLLQGWHQLTSHATATRREGMDKAAAAWKRRAWKVFGRRLEQQRTVLQAKGAALVAQQHRRWLREGLRVWVLQCKVARFEGLMLERHPRRAPTTLARCLVTWAVWARHRCVFRRAAVAKGERQWEARMVARAVQSMARNARLKRRARAAERKGNKARITRAIRQAFLLKWLPRIEAWRLRRVLMEKVDAAERHLEAKVLAATTAAAVTAVGAAEHPRMEENEQEMDAASTIAYLQQQLLTFKGQRGMLAAQQRAAESCLCALEERLGHLTPSASSSSIPSSSSSGEKAGSLKEEKKKTMNKKDKWKGKSSDTASSGDMLLAARQFKALCHKQAQEVAILAEARREMAGRVREVKGQMQELIGTTHRGAEARAMRLRGKRVEKAALEKRLAQLRHAAGSNGGDGGRKGGRSGGGRRDWREDEKQDLDLSQMLGLDDDEDGDEDVRGKKNAEKGMFMGRDNASTASTSVSSPIKKRSKTLFVPSPPRGMQPLRPSSRPIRCRSSVTAVGGLVFAGDERGDEGWQAEGGDEKQNDDGMFDELTDSIDALQARILDKLNNNV
eukprot:evm.model.NODE_24648_length_37160_cov_56.512592.6